MIIYMDGGCVQTRNNPSGDKAWLLTWGMVVHHNDETKEFHGSASEVHHRFNGFHELMAFAEAVRYIKHLNIPFDQVSFYTDDDVITQTNDGWDPMKYEKAKNRFMMLVNEFYPTALYDDMIECWENARFTKVKSHRNTVYNLRVDYLCSHARSLAKGLKEEFLTFEEWLAKGFTYYNVKKDEYDVWYAPFAESSN
jgi:ribonuclease HI